MKVLVNGSCEKQLVSNALFLQQLGTPRGWTAHAGGCNNAEVATVMSKGWEIIYQLSVESSLNNMKSQSYLSETASQMGSSGCCK